MTAISLHAVVLTPIHVGDGSTWTPETFKLDGDELLMFEPSAVLAGMDAGQRNAFTAAIDRGELHRAQQTLHQALKPAHVLGRIAVLGRSREEIQRAISDPARAGRVHPFIRSAGRPFLPGSTVKGAVRTAIVSARAQPKLQELSAWMRSERIDGGRTGRLSDQLQARILELPTDPGAIDSDPFRFVTVADAVLPEGSTRIDQVLNRRRDGRSYDMQMHFEALKPGTRFTLEMVVNDERAREADRLAAGKAPRRPIGVDELLVAVDRFYRNRWRSEANVFFDGRDVPNSRDGEGGPVMMRVGRFSHFESASVDGLRQGWNIKARRTMETGTTRAVTMDGANPVPFGWIMLFQSATAAAAFAATLGRSPPAQQPPGAAQRPPERRPAAVTSGRILMFRKGERVTHPDHGEAIVLADVPIGAARIEVEFDRDDSGTFEVRGWERA
jgi:CRISPR-associated protein Csm5